MAEHKLNGSGVSLSIYEGGQFTDESGAVKQFDKGIKITVGGFSVKLQPSQLAFIVQATQDPEVKKELTARLKEEQEQFMQARF